MKQERMERIASCLGWGICFECSGSMVDEDLGEGLYQSTCSVCGWSVAHGLVASSAGSVTIGFAELLKANKV
jgi:hypothetical protein